MPMRCDRPAIFSSTGSTRPAKVPPDAAMMKTANMTAAMDAILIRLDSRPLLKNINFTVPMRLIDAGRRRQRNRDSQVGTKVKRQRPYQRSRCRLTDDRPARPQTNLQGAGGGAKTGRT